jgi:hypothetical protein
MAFSIRETNGTKKGSCLHIKIYLHRKASFSIDKHMWQLKKPLRLSTPFNTNNA